MLMPMPKLVPSMRQVCSRMLTYAHVWLMRMPRLLSFDAPVRESVCVYHRFVTCAFDARGAACVYIFYIDRLVPIYIVDVCAYILHTHTHTHTHTMYLRVHTHTHTHIIYIHITHRTHTHTHTHTPYYTYTSAPHTPGREQQVSKSIASHSIA